ncbi:unnamed protein product [Acanthoscelides obtectus]|uniref:Protein kinase domain-containing protein n=1 Tax=Acanthoscelides obtectus TaxID=200917 RepID=A0A9P0P4N4_ACAOB|nr:unnamed protein product [Acanthoscelides obtectus]CAK1672685.1 SCY1-like protein 2 [Acanthoscelides obtectus]
MDVFNKVISQVSSSVSSTVSQLSGVLPGNPVTREFESVAHIASAGPGLLWKIYKGYKRSTKQEASIFVFEKRQLERYNKNDRDMILEILRRGVVQLTKIRHPKILIVQHPLEESRESLAFATEPVFASLANILGQTTNMPQPANMSDYKFFDIEIKYGLLQVSEGLAFLHTDVKLLHKNICPESIVINNQGAWKIFGLDFCIHNTSPGNVAPVYLFEPYSPSIPKACQPNLDFLAPECVTIQTHSPASDMFSLGMLTYTLHAVDKKCLFPIKEYQQYKGRVQELKKLSTDKLNCIPKDLRDFVKLLLNVTPEVRPDAHQFLKIPYFDEVGIKTLTYLDSLLQWDNLQKSQFYKGLPEALTKLPQRVKVQRVLACLVHDLGQPVMVPFILPSIFNIAENCTQQEFCMHIFPHLKPIMKLMEPIQILLLMLQRMELLLKLTPAADVQQHVLPMLYRGLDSDSPQVHELCLSVLPTFAGLLDHSNVKNSLLPRIKKLCLSTSTLSVRVNCLLCVGRLLEHLDKWLVLDEVLPFLPQIPSREPAVLMGILGIYKLALNHKKLGITKEIIATRVLPFLIPLCIENGLTLQQFTALTTLVKDMFQIVEAEHRTKLEQLNSVKDEQKTLASTVPVVKRKINEFELGNAFSGLGLESFVSESQNKQLSEQKSLHTFENQTTIEPIKSSATAEKPPKDLSSSLLDDWIGTSKPTSDSSSTPKLFSSSVSHSFGINQNFNSLALSMNNQSMNMPNSPNTSNNSTHTLVNNQNWNSLPLSPNNNQSMGTIARPIHYSPMNASNIQQNMISGYNQHSNTWSNNYNQHFSQNSNPWSSNNSNAGQTCGQDNSQNWSALDNLLPTNNSNNAKIPMNMMSSQSNTFHGNSSNSHRGNALSNDEIMDLLS